MANSPVVAAAGIAAQKPVVLGQWDGSQDAARRRNGPRGNHRQTFLILAGGHMWIEGGVGQAGKHQTGPAVHLQTEYEGQGSEKRGGME